MRKALIVAGGWPGHQPELVSVRFKKMLEKEGFEVTIVDTLDVFAKKENIIPYDLVIPVWTQGYMSDKYTINLDEAMSEYGVGLAGCHGGMNDAFRNNIEWQFVVGSQWVYHAAPNKFFHCGQAPTEEEVDPNVSIDGEEVDGHDDKIFWCHYDVNIRRNSSSPIVKDIPDFSVFTEQYYCHVDPCVNVLATTRVQTPGPHAANGETEIPVAYTKLWGKAKIFFCSLGHQDEIFDLHPEAAELMRRGFLYAARE